MSNLIQNINSYFFKVIRKFEFTNMNQVKMVYLEL